MFAEKCIARMLLWRKKVAGLARVETAWDEQKARIGRTARQIDSKSSPSEKPVPSSTHLLRLVSDALDPQAEDLKPWTKFKSLAKHRRGVAAGDYVKSFAPISHCFHGSAGDAKFESTEKIEKDTSRAVMIQGDSRSRETRSFMTTVYRWVRYGTASIFMCAIRKIHDMGYTSLVAGRQIPSMPARLLTN
ncbi:hypothetical protein E4U52_007671 [Claviceps spartinae]|nr:hypothetical protein E4U52_007671 [Claviceps spartinae]